MSKRRWVLASSLHSDYVIILDAALVSAQRGVLVEVFGTPVCLVAGSWDLYRAMIRVGHRQFLGARGWELREIHPL